MGKLEDLILEELQKGAAKSKDYKAALDGSRSKYKKEYYLKKLRKNNEMNAKLLVALERLSEEKEDKNERTSNDSARS